MPLMGLVDGPRPDETENEFKARVNAETGGDWSFLSDEEQSELILSTMEEPSDWDFDA